MQVIVFLEKILSKKHQKIYISSTVRHDNSKSWVQSLQRLCKSWYSLIPRNIYNYVQYHYSEQWIKWLLQGFLLSINYKWHHQCIRVRNIWKYDEVGDELNLKFMSFNNSLSLFPLRFLILPLSSLLAHASHSIMLCRIFQDRWSIGSFGVFGKFCALWGDTFFFKLD